MREIDENVFQKRVGENLSVLRKLKGVSITKLSSKSNCNRNSLSKIEYGEQNPRYQTLLSIVKNLDVDFRLLYTENLGQAFQGQELTPNLALCDDDYLLVFVENCITQMKEKKITKKDMYIATGLAEGTISRILNRRDVNPTLRSLWALALGCKTTVGELFKRKK